MNPTPLLADRQLLLTLDRALTRASARAVAASLPHRAANAERSANFIECFSILLEEHATSAGCTDVHVFRRTRLADLFRRGKGKPRSEFLFDILVARAISVAPPVHRRAKPLGGISVALMQVESELATDAAKSVEDFSKLVCGAAPQSLFIGPLTRRPTHYLDTLGALARVTNREHHVALVPPPSCWNRATEHPRLYRWTTSGWVEVAR